MASVKFVVDPLKGVGPIRFGMTRAEVEQVMGKTPERDEKGRYPIALYDYFQDDGVFVFYDPTDHAIAAEFFEFGELECPPDGTFARPFDDVLAWVKRRDPNVVIETGNHFRSEALGMAGAPREDDAEDKSAESLLFHQPRYYEDSDRWTEEKKAAMRK
jgi:hypothetical protein